MTDTYNPYKEKFSSWADVQSQFEMQEPEPDQVFLARYDTGCYEGDATVYYRRGDKYYEVTGSHCSCYGLEGQWEPTDYDRETFIAVLRRRKDDENAQAVLAMVGV